MVSSWWSMNRCTEPTSYVLKPSRDLCEVNPVFVCIFVFNSNSYVDLHDDNDVILQLI